MSAASLNPLCSTVRYGVVNDRLPLFLSRALRHGTCGLSTRVIVGTLLSWLVIAAVSAPAFAQLSLPPPPPPPVLDKFDPLLQPIASIRIPNPESRVPSQCPKCGCDDESLIEQVDARRSFCNTCSHDWVRDAASHKPKFASVDVLVARVVTTVDGVRVAFDEVWAARRPVSVAAGIDVQLPGIDDLILTKRFAARPRDVEDIRLLRILQSEPKA